jgi:hypothetical protein
MNSILDDVFKAVSATLVAIAHPDPLTVINAIKEDFNAGDDIFETIRKNVSEDDHVQNLLDAKQAQDLIDSVDDSTAVDDNNK